MSTILRVLVSTLLATGAIASESFTMPWRVYRDRESSTAFRFPYSYRSPDMYRPILVRSFPARQADVVHFSVTTEELDAELRAATLEKIFAHVSENRLTSFTPWNYYDDADQVRPHAHPRWAPRDIRALRGSGPEHNGIILQHGDRYSGLLLSGNAEDHDNPGIIASFEILAGQDRPQTWRATQSARGAVFTHQGMPLLARGRHPSNVNWEQGWVAETEHYQISSSVSPAKTLHYAGVMEVLHRAFSEVFDPDRMPAQKMEIHIFNDHDHYLRAAAAAQAQIPETSFGFFSPGRLCIYVFDTIPRGYRTTTESILAHEASHQFLHMVCNGSRHVPTWINEGLAVYFENGDFSPNRMRWQAPRDRLRQLASHYRNNERTLQPLEEYLAHHGHIPGPNYAEVYAKTHYWIYLERLNPRERRFRRYWEALRAGRNGTEAFEEIFMADLIERHGTREKSLEELERVLIEYVTSGAAGREL